MTTNLKKISYGPFILFAVFVLLGDKDVSKAAKINPETGDEAETHSRAANSTANFTLTDQDGKRFQLTQLRGKIVILFFGYTSCPDACPTTLAKLSQVYKLLGAEGGRVVTVFISVDPQRDTPHALKEYLKYFKINTVGLTGTKKEIDFVVSKYGAKYEIENTESAAGYHINHSTDLYLLNQKGEIARRFEYADRSEMIAAEVRRLIR